MTVPAEESISLHVWSDYVCPFCYLELPEIERLKRELGERLNVHWHAFELRPDPQPTLEPDGEYLHRIWNSSVYPMADERGMALRLPPMQPRSRKALEAAEFAKRVGQFDTFHPKLFEAFFQHGQDIGSVEVLAQIGEQAGVDPQELIAALQDGSFTDRVINDERRASELRISGVPAALMTRNGKALILSGAQPYDALKQAVQQLDAADG